MAFPLLIIPLAIYNMFVFLTQFNKEWTATALTVPLPSGASWNITYSDALIAGSLLLLMIELIKPARPGAKQVIDHLLSIIVLGAAVAELVLVKDAATSTLAMLCVMCLAEVIGGIAISVRVSRLPREVAVVAPAHAATAAAVFEPPPRAAEPTHFLPDVSPLRDVHTSHPTDRPHHTP